MRSVLPQSQQQIGDVFGGASRLVIPDPVNRENRYPRTRGRVGGLRRRRRRGLVLTVEIGHRTLRRLGARLRRPILASGPAQCKRLPTVARLEDEETLRNEYRDHGVAVYCSPRTSPAGLARVFRKVSGAVGQAAEPKRTGLHTCTEKWRWGKLLVLPVLPEEPSLCPATTAWPTSTREPSRVRCP